jgi:hypothetical protein
VSACPFAQHRFDQGFGFAVRPWAVGLGVAPADAELRAGRLPVAAVVGLGVVAEDALERDPTLAIPGRCALQKRRTGGTALVGQQLCVGQARVIIDRDVQVGPARAFAAPDAVLADALADLPEARELLDVNV